MKKKVFTSIVLALLVLIVFGTVAYAYDVSHDSWRDYNSDGTLWRAAASTTVKDGGNDVYHYTRSRVVNALVPSVIYEDSGRVYGYSKTYAYTAYVFSNEPLFSMRSYYGWD